MKSLYLLINVFSFLIPLIFSFHPKLMFYKRWRSFIPAMLISAVLFLVWDEYFTQIGVWGFNPKYLSGFYVLSLPVEELLFFISIPYACVFTYHCFSKFGIFNRNIRVEKMISVLLVILLLATAFFNLNLIYTSVTFISLSIFILYVQFVAKPIWLYRFYITYLILIIPFFIVNGMLTGSGIEGEVVWYNENEFLGIRLGTIPFEDIFYGMELILLNVFLMHLFEKPKVINLV
ncbi:MAG TPA: lycopene cyclase domain-containing protein [Bacteroidia bacterium]|nr:lycopene cyclase domain-containing protein [Bacteroidia bacterium]HNT80713.1 lycopene cyclase domain-containing protein [Bacteroidia bacterium]